MSFEQSVTVGFVNQSKRPIEPCDCSSQSIFLKKSRDSLVKSAQNNKYQIATNGRSGRTHFVFSETQEHQISFLILVVALYEFKLIVQLLLVNLYLSFPIIAPLLKVNPWIDLRIREQQRGTMLHLPLIMSAYQERANQISLD